MLKVNYVSKIYFNVENGYSVNKYIITVPDDESVVGQEVTCVGNYLSNLRDIECELTGEWINDKAYGKQFLTSNCKEIILPTKTGIMAFLTSGLLKGVGPKTAESIYEMFKEDALKIIESEPNELARVKGITKKKAEKIHDSYIINQCAKEVISMLVPYKITSKLAMKVYKIYKENAATIIKNEPYDLCKIKGFGFKTVDKIARVAGIAENSPARVKACMFYVLTENEKNGNLCMKLMDFYKKIEETLNTPYITNKAISSLAIEMIKKKKLSYKKIENPRWDGKKEEDKIFELITRPIVFQTENELAQNVIRLNNATLMDKYDDNEIDKDIKQAEIELGIILHEGQYEAVSEALKNKFLVITGGPGTGKTTILEVFNYIYKKKYKNRTIQYMAPTGRAARRIKESTGEDAVTVHKAIKLRENEDGENESEDIDADIIIVDESSMLDLIVANALFKAIRTGKSVILVGDVDQLPSVGAGLVLNDIIESQVVKVVKLSKVFRQGEDSNIFINSQLMQKGKTHLVYGDDFRYYPAKDLKEIEDISVKVFMQEYEEFGIENVVYLSPYKEKAGGVYAMNKRLQSLINPYSSEKPEYTFRNTIFRLGDIVMQLKNEDEIANGDVGKITKIAANEDGDTQIYVTYFNTLEIEYSNEDLEQLTLAYAMSIHKSQGSEYKSVVTCLCMSHYIMLQRNLPYTAFTRGKIRDSFIGDKKALAIAIGNTEIKNRLTMTIYKLKFYHTMSVTKPLMFA